MKATKAELFLSYCWADEQKANEIAARLQQISSINLHQDKLDIKKWGSIKEYMQSISHMDYTILLISDAYLKSVNCMYEVLEVMRDRKYKDKIFPAIINTGIYKPAIRASYVKHWQQECESLEQTLQGIHYQNLGKLGENLKQMKDISSNIANFLDLISDMNNPSINDVCSAIEQNLKEHGFINDLQTSHTPHKISSNFFNQIGTIEYKKITDFEINQFILQAFNEINEIMIDLCKQLENQYPAYQATIEKIDSRNYFYQFYNQGNLIKNLKLFLDNSFGTMNIGLSNDLHSFGNSHSWNAMYTVKSSNGQLFLLSTLSYNNSQEMMTSEDVVKDIWTTYITPYL